VDLKKLAREPKIHSIVENASLGGLGQVVEAMRLSSDPILVQFLERWDRINPAFQRIVPFEAVAQLAGVDTRQLLGTIIIALREHANVFVKIAALSAHGEITKATVSNALLPGDQGFKDRQLIHQALGFLAPPKGQTINFNLEMPEPEGGKEIDPEDIDMNEMFPDLMTTQKLLPE
jgi:hypothetical protein